MWISVISPTSGENLFVNLRMVTTVSEHNDGYVTATIDEISVQETVTLEELASSIAPCLMNVTFLDEAYIATILEDKFGVKHVTHELIEAVLGRYNTLHPTAL